MYPQTRGRQLRTDTDDFLSTKVEARINTSFLLMRVFITLSGFKQNCNTSTRKNYPAYHGWFEGKTHIVKRRSPAHRWNPMTYVLLTCCWVLCTYCFACTWNVQLFTIISFQHNRISSWRKVMTGSTGVRTCDITWHSVLCTYVHKTHNYTQLISYI